MARGSSSRRILWSSDTRRRVKWRTKWWSRALDGPLRFNPIISRKHVLIAVLGCVSVTQKVWRHGLEVLLHVIIISSSRRVFSCSAFIAPRPHYEALSLLLSNMMWRRKTIKSVIYQYALTQYDGHKGMNRVNNNNCDKEQKRTNQPASLSWLFNLVAVINENAAFHPGVPSEQIREIESQRMSLGHSLSECSHIAVSLKKPNSTASAFHLNKSRSNENSKIIVINFVNGSFINHFQCCKSGCRGLPVLGELLLDSTPI